ncbi:MAG: SGNH/GDSL hydrolase family protein [Gammaproteobacteria bacterium]
MGHQLATIALGPVLLAQGIAARRRIPRLPEPPGAREGLAGRGTPLRLLVIGDSAAAGVGAVHQDEALLGQLVRALACDFELQYRLEARIGATTASTLEALGQLTDMRCDVVVTSLGVNDVTSGTRRSDWRRRQRALVDLLQASFGAKLVVLSGLPPVHGFPALPQPLRWYLGRRATQFDGDLDDHVCESPASVYVNLRFSTDAGLMAADGFHPGPGIYVEWARLVAAVICDRFPHDVGIRREQR